MSIFNNPKGFTLIEVLTAIGIFSIGFLAVASLQTASLNQTTSSSVQTEAMELASSHMEFLFQLPFYPDFNWEDDCLKFNMGTGYPLAAGNHDRDVDFNTGRVYALQWTVTNMDSYNFDVARNIYCDDPDVDVPLYKSIVIRVAEAQRPGRILAEMQFVKVCDYEI